jgi:hypothetical protein
MYNQITMSGTIGILHKIRLVPRFAQELVGKQPPGVGERQNICVICRINP